MTAFERALSEVRAGADAVAAARGLIAQLTRDELLGLLDGDRPFWRGVLHFVRFGYGRSPQPGGGVARLGIPGLQFTDGPRGVTLGTSTCFPVAMARGATWDVELEAAIGNAMGREARAQGANCIGAPCVNLLRHPAWGRAQETYGEDPMHVGALGAAFTRGVQEHAMACVKHFALNSIENARFEVDVEVDDDVLHDVYLPQFKDAIDAGARVVMSAYNSVNGTYCGDSAALLTTILRDRWGFDGFVISDWVWGMREPVGSVTAGLDIEMPFRQQRARALPEAVASGRLALADVERAATRIVATQLRHVASLGEAPGREVVACDGHRALARRAAARAMVLLRNERVGDRPVLPLDSAALRRVAVIGRLAGKPNLGDPGSSNVHPPSTVTILDGLRAALPGAEIVDDPKAADAAIVVVGYRAVDEGESMFATDDASLSLLPWPLRSGLAGRALRWFVKRYQSRSKLYGGDRARLALRAEDEALIARVAAVNPRTIVVVIAGSAVEIETWRSRVPAIVLAWYPGMEGGHALADVLLGRAEPGGRLPFVMAANAAHLPPFIYATGVADPGYATGVADPGYVTPVADPGLATPVAVPERDARHIRYERWHGHQLLEREHHAPAFPFGFGLGYTTMTIVDLRVDLATHTATVRVTNTGSRAGSTVVQLYARLAGEPRALVGFTRVELEAGASTTAILAWRETSVTRRATRFEAGQWAGDPAAAVT